MVWIKVQLLPYTYTDSMGSRYNEGLQISRGIDWVWQSETQWQDLLGFYYSTQPKTALCAATCPVISG